MADDISRQLVNLFKGDNNIVKEFALPKAILSDSNFNSGMGVLLEYILVEKFTGFEMLEGTTEFPDLRHIESNTLIEVKSYKKGSPAKAPVWRSKDSLDSKIKKWNKKKVSQLLMFIVEWEGVDVPQDEERFTGEAMGESDSSMSYIKIGRIYVIDLGAILRKRDTTLEGNVKDKDGNPPVSYENLFVNGGGSANIGHFLAFTDRDKALKGKKFEHPMNPPIGHAKHSDFEQYWLMQQ